jgi:hypothetical protein
MDTMHTKPAVPPVARPARATPAAGRGRSRRPSPLARAVAGWVEQLEDRQLFAVAGLNDATWTSVTSGKVTGAVITGNQTVSGRASDIATDPANANIFYVSTYGGGVWETTNGGASYTDVTLSQPALNIGAIAVAPSDASVIYAGTGNGDQDSASYYGQGILVSDNAGATWQLMGATQFARQTVAKIAVDPTNPLIVYAAVNDGEVDAVTATTGTADSGGAATQPAGVYKSIDGGKTWTDTTAAISTDDQFYDVEINPQNDLNVYTTFQSDTNGQSGIYDSTDGGLTYTPVGGFTTVNEVIVANPNGSGTITIPEEVQHEFSDMAFGRISLAIAPDEPDTIYAAISSQFESDPNDPNNTIGAPQNGLGGDGTTTGTRVPGGSEPSAGYLIKSTDGGATWTQITGVPFYSSQGEYSNAIIVDQANPATFYLGGTAYLVPNTTNQYAGEMYRGDFSGSVFTDLTSNTADTSGLGVNVHAFAYDADGRLLVATDQGVFRLDSPTTATPTTVAWDNLNANIDDVGVDNIALEADNGDEVLASDGVFGLLEVPGTSSTSTPLTTLSPVTIYDVVVDPDNASIVYGITNTGDIADASDFDGISSTSLVVKSTNGGATFTDASDGVSPGTAVPSPFSLLTMDPDDPNRLLVASGSDLYETLDGGATWTNIYAVSASAISVSGATPTITSIAIGNHGTSSGATTTDTRRIYLGTSDGAAYESTTNSVPQVLAGGIIAPSTESSFVEIDPPTALNIYFTNEADEDSGTTSATPEAPPGIARLVADSVSSATAFAVTEGFSTVDALGNDTGTGGHIYMTTDAGGSGAYTVEDPNSGAGNEPTTPGYPDIVTGDWTDITGNLPNVPFHDLLDVPGGINGFTRTLYVASDRGVYVSYDDGTYWSPLGTGLPDSPVVSLAIDTTTGVLAAGTEGMGVYEISTAFPGATIAARVFDDVNGTGLSDPSEPGVAGAVVQLKTAGADGIIGTADDVTVATTTTGALGDYSFTNVAPGTYYVHFDAPSTYYLSPTYTGPVTAAAALDDPTGLTGYAPEQTLGSTANPVTGNTGPIVISNDGTVAPTVDNAVTEGVYQKAVIVSTTTDVERPTSGDTTVTFTVTISPSNEDADVSVPYLTVNGPAGTTPAIAGTDYDFASGTLVFAPGVTTQTVTVTVLPSTVPSLDKSFDLDITAPSGFVSADLVTPAVLVNEAFPVASIASAAVTRDPIANELVSMAVTLDQPAPFVTSVQVATTPGTASDTTDFNAAQYTVYFPAGTTSEIVTFEVLPGTNPQLNKTFTVGLVYPLKMTVSPTAGTSTVTIVSNVLPTVSASDATVTESVAGATTMAFTVSLDASLPQATTVNYTTVDGTALAGTDYTAVSGTLTFTAGEVSQQVVVPISRRFVAAQTLTFGLDLSDPSGGVVLGSNATGTIVDPGTTAISFSGGHHPLVYTDNLGHRVTVTITGPGSGQLAYLGATPAASNANALLITGTTARSNVTVTVSGGGQTSFSDIQIDGALNSFSGKQVNLTGTFTSTGAVSAVTLNYMSASTMTIGGAAPSTVALTFNRVVDSSITSAVTIRSLTAGAYVNSSGVPEYITAPAVLKRRVKGVLGATIQTAVA